MSPRHLQQMYGRPVVGDLDATTRAGAEPLLDNGNGPVRRWKDLLL